MRAVVAATMAAAVSESIWASGSAATPSASPITPAAVPAEDPATVVETWFTLDDVFWITLLAIFLFSIVNALIKRRKRDRCLKLFDDDHVTFLSMVMPTVTGLVRLTPLGLELRHPEPLSGRRGLERAGTLLYDDEVLGSIALCRTPVSLNAEQRRRRRRQLRRSVRPGVLYRVLRSVRNFANAVSDGLGRAIALTLGRMRTTGVVGGVVSSQRAQAESLGQTLVTMGANAYEPLLERHIGRPVILEVKITAPTGPKVALVPGFLVDYTAQYVAIFNIDQDPIDRALLRLDASSNGTRTAHGISVTQLPDGIEVRSEALDPIVFRVIEASDGAMDTPAAINATAPPVATPTAPADASPRARASGSDEMTERLPLRAVHDQPERPFDEIVLLPGTVVRLPRPAVESETQPRASSPGGLEIEVIRTRQVDLICPRAVARVRYSARAVDTEAMLHAAGIMNDTEPMEPAAGGADTAAPRSEEQAHADEARTGDEGKA